MFEYTALVDAPVKRFTSIVTDPEPDEARVVAVLTAIAPVALPVVEAPALIVAVEREAAEREPVQSDVEQAAPVAPIPATPIARTPAAPVAGTPSPRPRTYAPPEPPSRPSFLPALIGIAAAGVTAMWWLRRGSHDR